jgi:hypothetical protein
MIRRKALTALFYLKARSTCLLIKSLVYIEFIIIEHKMVYITSKGEITN